MLGPAPETHWLEWYARGTVESLLIFPTPVTTTDLFDLEWTSASVVLGDLRACSSLRTLGALVADSLQIGFNNERPGPEDLNYVTKIVMHTLTSLNPAGGVDWEVSDAPPSH